MVVKIRQFNQKVVKTHTLKTLDAKTNQCGVNSIT